MRDSILPRLLPAGGAVGMALTKSSATNYVAGWSDLSALYAPIGAAKGKRGPSDPLIFSNVAGSAADRLVTGLASFQANIAQNGAIVFMAPAAVFTVFHNLRVSGFHYADPAAETLIDFRVAGGRQINAAPWINCSLQHSGSKRPPVSWGRYVTLNADGSVASYRNCLIVGDESTYWRFPHLVVEAALLSFQAQDAYTQGWSSAIFATLPAPVPGGAAGFDLVTPVPDTGAAVGTVVYPDLAPATGVAAPTYLKPLDCAVPEQHTPNCGNGVIDATAALRAMAALGGRGRLVKGGTYKITGTIVGAKALQWIAETGATIDASALPSGATALRVSGTQDASVSLTANAVEGTDVLYVQSTAPFTPFTLARLVSESIYDPVRTGSKLGELVRIVAINQGSSLLKLETPIQDTYLNASGARLYPMGHLTDVVFDGLSMIGDDVGKYMSALQVERAQLPRIYGPEILRFSDVAIQLKDCHGGAIYDALTEIRRPTDSGYGISIAGASQDILIRGHRSRGMRHAITTNNSNGEGAYGVTGRIDYERAVIYGTQTSIAGAGGDAVDTHAACRLFRASDIEIYESSGQAANLECRAAELENFRFRGVLSRGVFAANYTSRDGHYHFRNIRGDTCVGDVLRVVQAPGGSPVATGLVRSIKVDGLAAERFTGLGINIQNNNASAPFTNGPRLEISGVNLDAANCGSSSAVVIIQGMREVVFSPFSLRNVPPAIGGIRTQDVFYFTGYDLGKVEWDRSGGNSSGIAFDIRYGSVGACFGSFIGTAYASASNSATCFRGLNAGSGITFIKAQGNAATSGVS